ncbi:MAG: hypothetical protein IPK19_29470 [Chloroflexi bacterium]|nr:hypothetical protein [Chloroflexota bacterium]
MLQDREQRKRLIWGVLIIALGVMALINNTIAGETAAWMWIVGLAVAAILFVWAYLKDRELYAAIGGYVTGASAVLIFLLTKTGFADDGLWIPAVVLLGVALPFFAAWWTHRKEWGFLLVAYILAAVVGVLFVSERGALVPAYVMFVIGAPFVVSFVVTHKREPLIPGVILWLLALAFLGTTLGVSEQVFTVVVPLVAIAAGVYLLFGPSLLHPHERKLK